MFTFNYTLSWWFYIAISSLRNTGGMEASFTPPYKFRPQCSIALKCVIYSLPLQYLHAGFSYYFRLSSCAKYLLWGISKYFPKCSCKHITTANSHFTGRILCVSLHQRGEGITASHMHQRYRDISEPSKTKTNYYFNPQTYDACCPLSVSQRPLTVSASYPMVLEQFHRMVGVVTYTFKR